MLAAGELWLAMDPYRRPRDFLPFIALTPMIVESFNNHRSWSWRQ